MKCKHCKEEFHWCHNCGWCFPEQEGYCSEKCFNNSDETKDVMMTFDEVIKDMTNKQLIYLYYLMESGKLNTWEHIMLEKIKDYITVLEENE